MRWFGGVAGLLLCFLGCTVGWVTEYSVVLCSLGDWLFGFKGFWYGCWLVAWVVDCLGCFRVVDWCFCCVGCVWSACGRVGCFMVI